MTLQQATLECVILLVSIRFLQYQNYKIHTFNQNTICFIISHLLLADCYDTICQQNNDTKDKCETIKSKIKKCEGKNAAECL